MIEKSPEREMRPTKCRTTSGLHLEGEDEALPILGDRGAEEEVDARLGGVDDGLHALGRGVERAAPPWHEEDEDGEEDLQAERGPDDPPVDGPPVGRHGHGQSHGHDHPADSPDHVTHRVIQSEGAQDRGFHYFSSPLLYSYMCSITIDP